MEMTIVNYGANAEYLGGVESMKEEKLIEDKKEIERELEKRKQKMIDEIITICRYDLQNEENPKEAEQEYREKLEKIPENILQKYIDEEINDEDFYDDYISKV